MPSNYFPMAALGLPRALEDSINQFLSTQAHDSIVQPIVITIYSPRLIPSPLRAQKRNELSNSLTAHRYRIGFHGSHFCITSDKETNMRTSVLIISLLGIYWTANAQGTREIIPERGD